MIENQVLPTQAIISSCFMEYTADNTGTIMLFVKKKVWINAFVRLLLNCLLVEISWCNPSVAVSFSSFPIHETLLTWRLPAASESGSETRHRAAGTGQSEPRPAAVQCLKLWSTNILWLGSNSLSNSPIFIEWHHPTHHHGRHQVHLLWPPCQGGGREAAPGIQWTRVSKLWKLFEHDTWLPGQVGGWQSCVAVGRRASVERHEADHALGPDPMPHLQGANDKTEF